MSSPTKITTEGVVANGAATAVAKKIKSLVLTSTSSGSDYSNLAVKDEDFPKIEKNDQVIVRIKCAGLNFAELMQRQGLYKPTPKTPYTPGFEASGVVEEIGSEVTDLQVNDRVVVFGGNGMWKEVVRVPRLNVVKIPNDMSFEDAAGLIVNYVTAYQILFRQANLQPNDVVLVHMAAGGVGFAAIQLCKTVPGVVVIGTASASKHESIRANGCDHPIDYTSSNYVSEIKKLFPDGIDIVMDPLNGDNSIKGYDLLRPLGRIVHYGAASMTTENRSLISAFKTWWKCLSINSLEIISENKSVSGYHLGCLFANSVVFQRTLSDIQKLFDLYEQGKIKITIDSEFPYSKIGEAMKRMHTRQNVGKILLKPDSEYKEKVTANTAVTSTTVSPVTTEQVKISTTSSPTVATTPLKVEESEPPKPVAEVPQPTTTETATEVTAQVQAAEKEKSAAVAHISEEQALQSA